MSFGKRASTIAPSPAAPMQTSAPVVDPHGRRKVFQDDAWNGPTGDLLREMGMSPNDESNLVPNVSSVNEKLDAGHAALKARVAAKNAELAGRGVVRPFSLIPDPCWTGEMGHFLLLRLDLFPFEDWNIALLPADEATALMMDMPYHPNCDVPAFVEVARRFMADADRALRAAHTEATRTHDFARYVATRDDVRDRVKRLAHFFLSQLDEAWKKSKPVAHKRTLI